MKVLLIWVSIFLFALNFLDISIKKKPEYNKIELFDSSLSFLNSIKNLIGYADSCAEAECLKFSNVDYGILTASIIRKRFYHGFSVYNFQDNWIAAIAQLSFGLDLASPVKSDEILRFPYAGCSQQVIVLMEIMKKKGIPYRSVGFPHHYAVELYFDNKWYFFDPDMEPRIRKTERMEDKWNRSADSLKKYYAVSMAHLDWGFGKSDEVKIGKVNAQPAPNASIFQSCTNFLSKTLWLLPLIVLVYRKRKPIVVSASFT